MPVTVRKARETDFPRIYEIEQHSYPEQLHTTLDVLRLRHEVFGIWVAELDGVVAGFHTCVPARLDWPRPDLSAFATNRMPDYLPWFETYRDRGSTGESWNSLINTSTAVEHGYQGRGVGTALVRNSLGIAQRHGLKFRVSALRCEYAAWHERTGEPIEAYIAEVSAGRVADRYLSLYRRLGFVFAAPLPDYEPDLGSLDFCVFSYKVIEQLPGG